MSVPIGEHKVYIYKDDYNAMCVEVYRHQHIETGGNLFGLWRTSGSAVIHVVLGPGQRCRRTDTSFHQDMEYMQRVGRFVNKGYMSCHIGEWRSHHSLSLSKPNAEEERFIRRDFPRGFSKFLVIIANIKNGDTIKLSPYFFTDGGTRYEKAEYVVLESDSPFSTDAKIMAEIAWGAEGKEYQPRREITTLGKIANHSGASLRYTRNRRITGLNSKRDGNINPTQMQANQSSSLVCLSPPEESNTIPENATCTSQPGTSAGSKAGPHKSKNDEEQTPSEREIVLKKVHDDLKYWYGVQYDSAFKFETSKDSPGAVEISFKRNDRYWMVRFPEDFPTKPAKLFNSSGPGSTGYNECSNFGLAKPLNNEANILWAVNNMPGM
ncbi:Hypothetical predicted protein [Paramuricea clavata]|uniref:Uncharacterized protein n=1 Tax=Paramuricea clavata TaxID=317549 RepID=A0A6S7H5F8_PARCT|nr:Hypothetical predicted protein [Paramuricea clavata]